MNRITSIALGVAGISFFLGVWVGTVRYPDPVTCFEDEVATWGGDAHDHCLPIDDLWLIYPID